MPCFIQPLKSEFTISLEHRLKMLKLLFKDLLQSNAIQISEFELNNKKPSYTIDTLTHFKQRDPKSSLYFVMGVDSFLDIKKWHKWQEILTMANIIVFSRSGSILTANKINDMCLDIFDSERIMYKSIKEVDGLKLQLVKVKGSKLFYFIDGFDFNVSSTNVRNGKIKKELIGDEVSTYISDNELYKEMKLE